MLHLEHVPNCNIKRFRNPAEHPLYTGRELVGVILPFIAGFVMSLLVGMLDTAMVSTVGEEAVSGVSLVDNLMQLMVFIFLAFGAGGSIVAGQYLGSGNAEEACESTEQLLLLAGGVSTICMVLVYLLRVDLLHLFFGSITAEVSREAQIYIVITVFSLPGMALYEASLAAFRAMGEARTTMYISLVMNLVNVLGNALLIFYFHMGTAGVAWPTLVSRWVGAVIAMGLLMTNRYRLHIRIRQGLHIRLELMKKILQVGIPNGIENGIFQLGKLMTLSIISGFGTQAIAANAVAMILTNIISVPGWGINQTTVTLVSQCVGASDYEQARFYKRLMNDLSHIVITLWAILIWLALPWILMLFQLSTEAVSIARGMILIHAVGSALVWGHAFITPTAVRASGDTVVVMIVSIASMWIFRVGCAWLLCRVTPWGALNVWIAMDLDWIFRALVYEWYWKKERWIGKRVVG